MANPQLPPGALLLYDGSCGFCAQSVQYVLRSEERHGGPGSMKFATLEGPFGAEVRRRFPNVANADSIILYDPGQPGGAARALVRSDAALQVASYLGGGLGTLATVAKIVPRPLRDAVYNFVARHRHQIAGAPSCLLPTEQQRTRFLDLG